MALRLTLGAAALLMISTTGCEREAPPPEPVGETTSTVTPSTQPVDAPVAATPTAEPTLPPGHPPITSAGGGGGSAGPVTLSGMTFQPDPAWKAGAPTSMRAAQFELPGAESAAPATLVVYYFGPDGAGSIDENLARWAGQFEVPSGEDVLEVATMDDREIDGMPMRTMDLAGTYVAETRPGSNVRMRELDWRLLAAIVETEAGPYYFKLVGPDATVSRWESAYGAMLSSIERGPMTGAGGTTHP
jgi:hypothetical protein